MANVIEWLLRVKDETSGPTKQAIGSLNGLKAALAGVGAGFALAKFVQGTRDALEFADASLKMARSVGVSVEALTGMTHAAKMAGVEQGQLVSALRLLNQRTAEAAGGNKEYQATFASLGISIRDAGGKLKSTEALFKEVATVFSQSKDDANKTALAMQLMGRSGAQMIPLLNGGAQGLEDMHKEAAKLGLVISTDTAVAAEEFNDNIARFRSIADGAFNKMIPKILPHLTRIGDVLAGVATDTDAVSTAANTLTNIFKGLVTAGFIVGQVFSSVGRAIGAVAAAVMLVTEGEFRAAKNALKEGWNEIQSTGSDTAESIRQLWADVAVGTQVLPRVTKATKDAKGELEDLGEKEKEAAARKKAYNDELLKGVDAALQSATSYRTSTQQIHASIAELVNLRPFVIQAADAEAYALAMQNLQLQLDSAKLKQAGLNMEMITMSDIFSTALTSSVIGFSDAIAQALVTGESMGDALKSVFQGVLKQIISSLIQMGIQRLVLSMVDLGATATEASVKLSAAVATAAANGAAWGAAFGGPAGAAASGKASAAAAFSAGVTGSQMGRALGAVAGRQFGGSVIAGQPYIVGERGPELVVPGASGAVMTASRTAASMNGGGPITVNVMVDGRQDFTRMSRAELREALGQPIVDALNEMARIGVRPA